MCGVPCAESVNCEEAQPQHGCSALSHNHKYATEFVRGASAHFSTRNKRKRKENPEGCEVAAAGMHIRVLKIHFHLDLSFIFIRQPTADAHTHSHTVSKVNEAKFPRPNTPHHHTHVCAI